MPIHEKSLIRPENLVEHEHLVIDGVDVSGHWSTFIKGRSVTDYNDDLQDEIAALPGGENIHRCWQCGSCTNACTVNAVNPEFNPRYWIYLIRLGMEEELLRDKDIIWQCVSCNKCTYACPRDVVPEGVMKATAHWLELKGHTDKSPSTHFDEGFTDSVIKTGKIEETRVLLGFFRKTGQHPNQPWLARLVTGLVKRFPLCYLTRLGWGVVFRPRTSNWGASRRAINEYVHEVEAQNRAALGLDAERGH
ncbi:MAG: 4Fe-4S dicluster domain-containing protein [Rhodobacteraceae bacterium]|nr:4Fe-4S dicluster domain-containing protein [Paracoccaceae bacterium]